MEARFESLGDMLRHQAASQPDARAYAFLTDAGGEESVLTFLQLDRQAQAIAADLARRAQPGERALLVFSPASTSSWRSSLVSMPASSRCR
jgi:acyl-CoA synthetase (AMP-forming)/AMP-acid ligase II